MEPIPGLDVSADDRYEPQKVAMESFVQYRENQKRQGRGNPITGMPNAGSVVVLDVHSGAVLTMAKLPKARPVVPP